jgi:hypothetical protein
MKTTFKEFLTEIKIKLGAAPTNKEAWDSFWEEYSSNVFIFDHLHHFYGDVVFELKPVKRDNTYAIRLSGIVVAEEQRKQGKATEAMKWLMGLAVKHNLAIELSADPFSKGKKLSKAGLIKWYKSLGFVKDSVSTSNVDLVFNEKEIVKENVNQFFTTRRDVENYVRKLRIRDYTINNDLTVDVDGDVDIGKNRLNFEIEKLPIKFGYVSGHFDITHHKLTTLEGCPREVGESFDCSDNELTTLIGSPREVGKVFWCLRNKLTSLEGAPREIGGILYAQSNKFTEEPDHSFIKSYDVKWKDVKWEPDD